MQDRRKPFLLNIKCSFPEALNEAASPSFLLFCRFLLLFSFFNYNLNTFLYTSFPLELHCILQNALSFFLSLVHIPSEHFFLCYDPQICSSSSDHCPGNRSHCLLDITAGSAPQILQTQHIYFSSTS